MSNFNFNLSEEAIAFIKNRGYHIGDNENGVTVKNKKKVAKFVLYLSAIAGVGFIIVGGGEYKLMILGILFLCYPILNYRKNNSRVTSLSFKKQSFAGIKFSSLARIRRESTEEYRTATPFHEGNKNYVDLVTVETIENSKVELFYFVDPDSRKENLIEEITSEFARVLGVARA